MFLPRKLHGTHLRIDQHRRAIKLVASNGIPFLLLDRYIAAIPMIMRHVTLLALGGVLLYFGAAWLVRGAVGIATKLRVRPLIIGLTVVAYGTSAPELVVGISAALAGRGEIAFGNAIGSCIANLGLILGATALISPPKVDSTLLRRELPVMVLSALAVPILLLDNRISRLEGAGLLLAAAVYTVLMIRSTRPDFAAAQEVAEEARAASPDPPAESMVKLVAVGLLGLTVLVLGGNSFVDGASGLARVAGVSERLVGLTVVAVGTSLPELATSLIAARRGHSDIAVGNVIGSNIFNVLLILGASGATGPLDVALRDARVDLIGLVVVTVAGAVFLRGDRKISRVEGATLLVLYTLLLATLAITSRT